MAKVCKLQYYNQNMYNEMYGVYVGVKIKIDVMAIFATECAL